jgi:hypothetical protein
MRRVLIACCLAAAACGARGSEASLAIAGRTNAHATLAAIGERVYAAWAASLPDGATDIYLAVSRDGGRSFDAPVRVNATPGDASAGGEQPPRVTASDREVDVLWVAKRDGVSIIRTARSVDGGRTFERPRTISPAGATGARGWESAAIDADGVMHAAWLDGRNAATAAASHDHMAMMHEGGPRQDIFAASWRGGGPVVESRVATDVCFCCKTAVASRGRDVYVAWRHLYSGGVRDIAVAHSADGGLTYGEPVRVSADNWQINACPDDGPALALDTAGTVHVAWPTLVHDPDGDRIAIFHAVSRDGGRTFSPRARVDGARHTAPAHPRMALLPDGTAVVIWDELTGGRRQIALRAIATDGQDDMQPVRVLTEGHAAAYPSIVAAGDRLVAAWTAVQGSGSVIVVRPLAR